MDYIYNLQVLGYKSQQLFMSFYIIIYVEEILWICHLIIQFVSSLSHVFVQYSFVVFYILLKRLGLWLLICFIALI